MVSLPLIMTLLGFQKHLLGLIRSRSQSLAICRKHLWDLQTHSRESLISLMSMNPQAQNLRLQRKQAEKAYKTALLSGNPKAILIAKLHLLRVISHQTVFRSQQLQVLKALNAKILNTKRQVQVAFENAKIKDFRLHIPSLQVKTRPFKSPSPDYITKNNFIKVQTSYASWKVHSLGWALGFNLNCGVTLTEEKNLWELALIGKDKP
jgi:hypothetical protein